MKIIVQVKHLYVNRILYRDENLTDVTHINNISRPPIIYKKKRLYS